jgi:eukaryotic-like serine/threonine-protein kinase
MNPAARWSRVSSILSLALDLPEAQRTAFLAEAIRQEPALGTEVFALFEEMRQAEEFLEAPAATPLEASAGTEGSFGPYRVVGELGEGGMGVVHLAERNDGQFTRRVAIKRVGNAAPGGDVLRRFRDERQILARLDHPNIARLLDAGLDGAGVPYLVMEHVEGVPVTSYCRERKLAVRQRLALFLKVCAAVQHAHQNLVIHRDIKPGNILVTPEGEPKLLDFGIARVLSETPGGDATRTMNRALTLDYASPEQVRGDAVTTASDVYSLGVLLYELLADTKPYQVGARSLTEAVRLVCESVPPPPSRVAPPERRSELAGDLDCIVGKAMEKAPADRYGSVAELAADLASHLDHLPVKARRPSFGYVARKFVRRHRAGATVAAAVLVLLAGGMAAVLWQARVAERERARAQRRFEQVRQIAHYVIFDLHDGIAKLTGSTELRRQMVERSLAYLDSLAAEAAGDARLQMELAAAYSRLGEVLGKPSAANLGDREGAIKSYGKARELLDQVVSRNPGDADARRSLGRLLLNVHTTYGFEQRNLGVKPLEESLAIWQRLVREDPTHEENLRGLASAHFSMFIHAAREPGSDKAVPHMDRALEAFEKLLAAKPDDLDRKRNVALCHKTLSAHVAKRDPARAFQHVRRAAQLDSERLAAEPDNAQAKIDYTFDLSALGDYHSSRREYDDALRQFERALALRRELWAADQANAQARDRLAYMLMRVAEMQMLAGRHRLAAPLLQESVAQVRALPKQGWEDMLTLSKAYLFLGEVALASKNDPCPWYRPMAELLLKVPEAKEQGFFEPATAKLRDRALERLKSCPVQG